MGDIEASGEIQLEIRLHMVPGVPVMGRRTSFFLRKHYIFRNVKNKYRSCSSWVFAIKKLKDFKI